MTLAIEERNAPAGDALGLQDAMAKSHAAYATIAGILDVVPASRWSFAEIDANGSLSSLCGSRTRTAGLAGLRDELDRQRPFASKGPRLAPTLRLEGFASGTTLVFADARRDRAVLTLLRAGRSERFTAAERTMLTFALDAASERLSLRHVPAADAPAARVGPERTFRAQPPDTIFYVLDLELRIRCESRGRDESSRSAVRVPTPDLLPPIVEKAVRELVAPWSSGTLSRGVACPVPFLVVRTEPMFGPGGLCIGVHIDRFRQPNSLANAAATYRISPREMQVLALLLDGNHLKHIAGSLFITSSTVQDHIKSMLDKTGSRNRSELLGRVLGWNAPESVPA